MKPRRRLRIWIPIIIAGYAVWIGAIYIKQDSMVFPRQYCGPAMKVGRLPPRVQSVWIEAGSKERPERVEAWYLPSPRPGPYTDGVASIIYCHGNAELIDDCMERAMEWNKRGFAVLIPEYRGYGRSGGTPSQQAITEDLVRFYDTLIERPEIDRSRIFIHGRSLGGGVAAQIAAARPTAGLILESTFTSVASFAWGVGAPPWICKHPFRSDAALRGYSKPVLILHGTDDDIIPVSHGRALHKLLPSSTYIETPGDHIHYPPDVKAFWQEAERFITPLASGAR